MRVFAAGFQHETNSFGATKADWAAFERGDFFPRYSRGAEMLAVHEGGGLPMAGFLAEARRRGWQVLGSVWAGASPSAHVTRDAFERIAVEILEDVGEALASGPLDGIYLDLHGAAVCEHLHAPETELLRQIRNIAGPDLPIVASLDMHANVDEGLLSAADYLVAYRTYPHIDMVATGDRASRLLAERMAGVPRRQYAMARPPFLIPIVSQSTMSGPMKTIYDHLAELETAFGGAPSFCPGFPAADVTQCGPTAWAYGDHAQATADDVFLRVLDYGQAWRAMLLAPREAILLAIDLAAAAASKPVIVADVQDNAGAGADSNTTGLLHALLATGAGRRWPGQIAIGLINDPEAALTATNAGVGAAVQNGCRQVRSGIRRHADRAARPRPLQGHCAT